MGVPLVLVALPEFSFLGVPLFSFLGYPYFIFRGTLVFILTQNKGEGVPLFFSDNQGGGTLVFYNA